MPRYLLKISFDGTGYHGWQVQPNGITVQEQMQNSLFNLLKYRPGLTGCSRTDAGVHANEFYCHFDLDEKIPESGIVRGLNSILPDDIRVYSCKSVSDDFHCRYNALGKNYIYRIDTDSIQDPFSAKYALNYSGKLDIEKMNIFCSKIVGTHDFCGFSSSKRTVENTIRTVSECSVTKAENIVTLSITADGFLYNMVRIITGTAISVGASSIDIECLDKIIASRDRSMAGNTAPAKGLFLNKVYYPEIKDV